MDLPTTPKPLRILLVGVNEGLARSLARCLHGDARFALKGAVPTLARALVLLRELHPDLAVIEWAELGPPAFAALSRLRTCCPGLCIACVGSGEGAYREAASLAGVDFFLCRDRLYEEFCSVFEAHGEAR